ncbi:MAG: acetamidase/formamidase family protein [Myxococcales bacterium]
MKNACIAATLLAVAAGPSFAKHRTIPITRINDVPVKCAEEPLQTCHNRWHPQIPSAMDADPGDVVTFHTRDAFDNPFNRESAPKDVAAPNLNLIHPLTGPLHVNGASRGDVLAVTLIDVEPGPDHFGYTVAVPGFGFLRDVFTDPAVVHWELPGPKTDGGIRYATSRDLPGVSIPLHGFAGTMGVELGDPEVSDVLFREEELRKKNGFVLPPEPMDAVPASLCGPTGPARDTCLRTIPPRENGGNTDVKQMVKGTTLLFPCFIEGCGLSIGDVHWAQGDGEVSGTAIEMNAIVTVKVEVRKGYAAKMGNFPRFESNRAGVLAGLEPDHFIATMGIPVKKAGIVIQPEKWFNADERLLPLTNQSEDVTLAARDALIKMIDLLTDPGTSPAPEPLTRVQAYLLCSVACDLRISNLVDVPNYIVTDFLHLDVFEKRDDDGRREHGEDNERGDD